MSHRTPRFTICLLAALACSPPLPGAQPRDAPPVRGEPVSPPTARNAGGARIEVRAPIVRVSVRVAESFPPQYFADITSALPDGCAGFARAELRRAGATVFVDVFNTRPARDDMACTMVYGEKETAVALGSEFRSGETYTLDVNGTRETFVAQ